MLIIGITKYTIGRSAAYNMEYTVIIGGCVIQ